MAFTAALAVLAISGLAHAAPFEHGVQPHDFGQNLWPLTSGAAKPAPFCFPSLGFAMPINPPPDNTNWWCDPATEYAFVGFSYEVTDCR